MLESKPFDELLQAFKRALELYEKILICGEREKIGFIKGISGEFIEPGASGSLTRGKIEILPTGRNFYAVDPNSLPTNSAWKVGVESAEKLLTHYLEKHGRYPETVGHVLWSIDGYKADGEQLAQILYLIGVKPSENRKRIEVIPLEELGRPRIDVCIRISGILRDTLPNFIYLIDEAVSRVISLDEPLEMNYIKKHYLQQVKKLLELGSSERFASCRIFGPPPGAYGAGVNYAVEASAWKSNEDLARVWVHWSSFAYSANFKGVNLPEVLLLNLKNVDIVTRNHVSDEHDLLNCCGYFSQHGGFYNTVKALKEDVECYVSDTKDLSKIEIREMKDELERIVNAKLLNDLWIKEMMKHGYRGANEFSKKILHLFGWSATSDLVEDWIFDQIAEKYVLNEEMRKFFEQNNIYAFEEITRRLIEANARGLWNASDERIKKLKEIYGIIEGILEENLVGEVQGGAVEFLSPEEVVEWRENISEVIEAFKRVKT